MFPSAPVSGLLGKNLLYALSKSVKAADTTPTDPLVNKDLQALRTALRRMIWKIDDEIYLPKTIFTGSNSSYGYYLRI